MKPFLTVFSGMKQGGKIINPESILDQEQILINFDALTKMINTAPIFTGNFGTNSNWWLEMVPKIPVKNGAVLIIL